MTLCALFGWGQPVTVTTNNNQTHSQVRQHVQQSAKPTPSASPIAAPPPIAPTPTAPSEIASEQTCPGQSEVAKTVSALTCLTSNARKFHGLSAVAANPALLKAAAAKDQDMARCGYGHTACSRAFDYQIKAAGYSGKCYGENIAMGQATPREVFVAWMKSPGHRANILNAKYHDLGVAELAGSKGPLWVMELGGC